MQSTNKLQKFVVNSRTPTGCAAHLEFTFASLSELQAFAQKTTFLQAIYIFFFKNLPVSEKMINFAAIFSK